MKIDYLKIYDTLDFSTRQIPIITLQGREPGATLWLTANCHGDEVTPIEVIHRVLDRLKNEGLARGTLYAMPMLNPLGNELVQRHVPLDDADMNRHYPGQAEGSFSDRMAHLIYQQIATTQPDLAIDLHTMNLNRTLPMIFLDRFTEDNRPELVTRMEELAYGFGVTVVYDFEMEIYQKEKLDRSLSGALLNKGKIISYTLELGPYRLISEPFVEMGVRGIFNTLQMLNMIDPVGDLWRDPSMLITDEPLRRDYGLRANSSGILQFLVAPGEFVRVGQPVARVKNILGEEVEVMRSPREGYVLYLMERGTVHPGAEVLALAIPDK